MPFLDGEAMRIASQGLNSVDTLITWGIKMQLPIFCELSDVCRWLPVRTLFGVIRRARIDLCSTNQASFTHRGRGLS